MESSTRAQELWDDMSKQVKGPFFRRRRIKRYCLVAAEYMLHANPFNNKAWEFHKSVIKDLEKR